MFAVAGNLSEIPRTGGWQGPLPPPAHEEARWGDLDLDRAA